MATAETDLIVSERPELLAFRQTDREIAKLAAECAELQPINGLADKKGFAVHRAALTKLVGLRGKVEKRRKELKAASIKEGRDIDSVAKSLDADILKIEGPVRERVEAITEEEKRIEQEKIDAKNKIIAERVEALRLVGETANPLAVGILSPQQFSVKLEAATAIHNEKLKAEAKEKAEREAAEAKRQADIAAQEEANRKERERLAAIQREQDERAAALKAQQDKIDAEERERKRLADLEEARKQAASDALAEADRRRIAAEAQAKADAEAKEAARIKAESERPYREQLSSLAKTINDLPVPVGPCDKDVNAAIRSCVGKLRSIAAGQL